MNKQSTTIRIINYFFPIFFAVVIFLVGIPVATYHYFARDLQSQELLMNRNETGLILYDNEGEPFFNFYEAKSKEEISLEAVPQHMQDAVVAIEDKNFYEHQGYSIPGIVRSFFTNLREKEITQGGSTITQQLVKNSLLSPERSYLRKYQEVVLAQEIERRYSKKDILEMYLNSVYFGEGAFGVEQAARTYFNKSAQELSLAESALLAGILPAPSALSPITGDYELAKSRQRLVLESMKDQQFITEEEFVQAVEEPLAFSEITPDINSIAPHFALLVRQSLIERYGEEEVVRYGMKVHTTLDRDLQIYAEEAAARQVEALASQNVTNSAVVVIDPDTRAVRAMVGSIDWMNNEFGKVNVAISPRQPGSSFKPFVYAKALEMGVITPVTVLHDKKTVFTGGYSPENYDRTFRGLVTVRRALANSLNIPAVEVMTRIGVENGLEMAKRLGIESLKSADSYGPALVLGTGEISLLEMTNAYATFAAEGTYEDSFMVTQIEDKYGNVVYERQSEPRQVLDPEIAYVITSILSDRNARREAFGNTLDTAIPAAVKTGTTDSYKDSWTIGYTPKVVVGVWVGNNDNQPMAQIAGSLGAAPIWRAVIEYASQDYGSLAFHAPQGVVRERVCPNGLRVPPNAPANFGYTEYFIEGSVPTSVCSYSPPDDEQNKNEGENTEEQRPPDTPQPEQPTEPEQNDDSPKEE